MKIKIKKPQNEKNAKHVSIGSMHIGTKIKIKKPNTPNPIDHKQLQTLGKVKIERMSVEDLNPADYNPRTMTDRAREGLSNSIDQFGLLQPIIFNIQTGNIVGGHQRLYDLISKGVSHTDVLIVDLSLSQEKAANVSLNNNQITGDYTDGLQTILQDIDEKTREDLLFDDLVVDIDEFEEDMNKANDPDRLDNTGADDIPEVDDMDGEKTMLLKFTRNQHMLVSKRLEEIGGSREDAFLQVLGV